MVHQGTPEETNASAFQLLCRLGFWSAALTAAFTTVSFAIAISTPPISGPGCISACVTYPYTAVASYVPHDYIWMYPAMLLAPMFVVLVVCLYQYAAPGRKLYGLIALAFALMYAAMISIDYFVQLSVIQPSLLKGETEGLALFTQYNPHGIFIALEDLAYLMLSGAFFFLGWVFEGNNRLEGTLRWLLRVSGIVTVAAFVVMSIV